MGWLVAVEQGSSGSGVIGSEGLKAMRSAGSPPSGRRRREGLPEAIRKELGLYGFEKHQGEE
jgi:hypothetical protein